MNGMMMQQPQTTQLLLHGVIEARILEADLLSVTTDGKLQPSKKVPYSICSAVRVVKFLDKKLSLALFGCMCWSIIE